MWSSWNGQLILPAAFGVAGSGRLSGDIDATRTNPPKHKLDAEEVAAAIRRASDEPLLRFNPGAPETDAKQSLDFDGVRFFTERDSGHLAVEVSYREGVIDEPERVTVGPPYYEPFEIAAMTLEEATAEKLRTLLQRRRATDLADLALILAKHSERLNRGRVGELAAAKFQLVKQGEYRGRIEAAVEELRAEYVATIPGLDPEAPAYEDAAALVLRELTALLP